MRNKRSPRERKAGGRRNADKRERKRAKRKIERQRERKRERGCTVAGAVDL